MIHLIIRRRPLDCVLAFWLGLLNPAGLDAQEVPAIRNTGLVHPEVDVTFEAISGDWVVLDAYLESGTLAVQAHSMRTGETRRFEDLQRIGFEREVRSNSLGPGLFERWQLLVATEQGRGEDLNGDGDTEDRVLHVHNLATGTTASLGLAIQEGRGGSTAWSYRGAGLLTIRVDESSQGGLDLNGDGDAEDEVVHLYELDTGVTTNFALAGGAHSRALAQWVPLAVSERKEGQDLNGDGDLEDNVLHVYDLGRESWINYEVATSLGMSSVNWIVFRVDERRQGARDLNGDGDALDQVVHALDLRTGTLTNLALHGEFDLLEHWLVISADEDANGADFNADGDTRDRILRIQDLETGQIWTPEGPTATATSWALTSSPSGAWLVVSVEEGGTVDLNSDGDSRDYVLAVYDLATGITTNLGYAAGTSRIAGTMVAGRSVTFMVSELEQGGEDLNGDGDALDSVCHLHDLESGTTRALGALGDAGAYRTTLNREWFGFSLSEDAEQRDLNGDGDIGDSVLHVHHLATGATMNLGLAVVDFSLSEDWIAFYTDDWVLHVADLVRLMESPVFLRGDCNDDGGVDLSDAVFLLMFNFLGGEAPSCRAACDANADGDIDGTADPIYTLTHRFLGGPPPPAPFPECGPETLPAETALDCGRPPVSCP